MPTAPPRTCPTAGCPGLWDGKRCTRCNRKPKQHGWGDDKQRGTRHERGYDHRWVKLRAAYLRHHPYCERCETTEGRIVLATDVHHKIPFRGRGDPLRLAWDNLEALCEACHAKKSAKESRK